MVSSLGQLLLIWRLYPSCFQMGLVSYIFLFLYSKEINCIIFLICGYIICFLSIPLFFYFSLFLLICYQSHNNWSLIWSDFIFDSSFLLWSFQFMLFWFSSWLMVEEILVIAVVQMVDLLLEIDLQVLMETIDQLLMILIIHFIWVTMIILV